MARRRAVIVYNPTSGFTRQKTVYVGEMARLLAGQGIDAELAATSGPGSAAQLASEAVAGDADFIVSHGGDGTANEVIQGMAGSRAALAVWPGGTTNVTARELRLPSLKEELAVVIGAAKTIRISLGRAKASGDRSGRPVERYFLMMAGVGLDAAICRRVNPVLKRFSGKFAFGAAALRHVLAFRPLQPFVMKVDGQEHRTAFALIANGRGYGAPIRMTPDARLQDPWFEVFVAPLRARSIGYVRDYAVCRLRGPAQTGGSIIRAQRVEASSAGEVWVEADGEVVGRLPMSFEIVPDALSVVVPP